MGDTSYKITFTVQTLEYIKTVLITRRVLTFQTSFEKLQNIGVYVILKKVEFSSHRIHITGTVLTYYGNRILFRR